MQNQVFHEDQIEDFVTTVEQGTRSVDNKRVEEVLRIWGGNVRSIEEQAYAVYVRAVSLSWCSYWSQGSPNRRQGIARVKLLRSPYQAQCDALGHLRVALPSFIPKYKLDQFAFVNKRTDVQPANQENAATSPEYFKEVMASEAVSLSGESRCFLDLPILFVEYRKVDQDRFKALDRLRSHLVGAVKFLAAIGITDFTVFGVHSDGPRVVIGASRAKSVRSSLRSRNVHPRITLIHSLGILIR